MNKSDLIRTVEEQRIKIEKYEKKLKDVIKAYKSLVLEKKALEESLKAVANDEVSNFEEGCDKFENSSNHNSVPGSCVAVINVSDADDNGKSPILDSSTDTKFSGRESVASSDTEDSTTLRQPSNAGNAKIVTLKRALATISAEKSRQEVAFTEDRKRLIAEQDLLRNQFENLENEHEKMKERNDQQINELRSTIRNLHCERESEQNDHGAMLKELQQKLGQERLQSEHFQKQMSSMSSELKVKEQQPLDLLERINILTNENEKLKGKLTFAEDQLKNLPKIEKLEKTITQLKAEHVAAIEKEQNRFRSTEKDNAANRNQHEERFGVLESKISEFTSAISQYERQRIEDSANLDKLKARIKSLENENQVLATHSSTVNSTNNCDSFNEVVGQCQQVIQRLKSMQSETGETQDLFGLLGLDLLANSDCAHLQCKKELDSLRDEYEKYKIRAQALLKSKHVSKDAPDNNEISHMRQLIVTLQQQLQEIKDSRRFTENESQTNIDDLRRTVAILKETHAKELQDLEQTCQRRIVTMESETLKQRERTLEVLVEKEKEISALRSIISGVRPTASTQATNANSAAHARSESRSSFHSVEGSDSDLRRNAHSEVDVFATPTDPAPTSLYYNQELSRKEKEIGNLKRDLRRLEGQLIEVQHSVVTKELIHYELCEKLKDEIRNLETKLARYSDNSNLEYLKNVFVQFAVSNDMLNKQHMLKAICVALKLNVKETDLLLKHYVSHAWFIKSTK